MSERKFDVVLATMLTLVPEDDELKLQLTKILQKSAYKAPEQMFQCWEQVQDCLECRFGIIKKDEIPEWESKLLKVWTNKE
jgi:hypothetical protein